MEMYDHTYILLDDEYIYIIYYGLPSHQHQQLVVMMSTWR